jgi:hypothetical protein
MPAMGYDGLLATGHSCLSNVGAAILIPPFWSCVGRREGGMCIVAKGWHFLSDSIV